VAVAADMWPQFHFIFSNILNHPKFEIQIGDLLDVQKSRNSVGCKFET
jgi:hypothetical protein